MAIENIRVFKTADITEYGHMNFLFHNEEWTDEVLTNTEDFRVSIHIKDCAKSEFEIVQAFSLMSGFYPDPNSEPTQSDLDLLNGKIAEGERLLSIKRLELIDLQGGIEAIGK